MPQKTEKSAPKKKLTYQEEQRRLDAYGYGRYLGKGPSVGVIENYNGDIGSVGRATGANNLNKSYTIGDDPYKKQVKRDLSATPQSRRHMNSTRADPSQRSLRNAGAISMSQEKRPAGSPSGVYQYRNQVL